MTAGFLLCGGVLGIAAPAGADTRVLTVGASGNYQYRTICEAVAAADADSNANNYYDIEIAPGTYPNDFPVVTRPDGLVTAYTLPLAFNDKIGTWQLPA